MTRVMQTLPLFLLALLLNACQPHAAAADAPSLPPARSMPTLAPQRPITRTPFRVAPHTATFTSTPTLRPTRTPTIPPTATPTVTPTLPPSASIDLIGYGQTLPLSCESRSAADWARAIGYEIAEMDIFNRLPRSLDPETGFVGDPYGTWGQIPPGAYGVHAAPVAKLLREMGVSGAQAAREMTLEEAQAHIAAGRPLVVWVVGHVEVGRGVPYTVDGQIRTVARYEHTVILIGYDAETVTLLDGAKIYRRPRETFLASWSALENMAIYLRQD